MKYLILVTLLLNSCTFRPIEPLGHIVVYSIECDSALSCNYKALTQCPLGFGVESYDNNIMFFWCSTWQGFLKENQKP